MESTFAYSCDIYYNFTTYWYVNLVMHLCSSFFLPATPEPRCSEPRSASHLDEDIELLATFTTTFRYIKFSAMDWILQNYTCQINMKILARVVFSLTVWYELRWQCFCLQWTITWLYQGRFKHIKCSTLTHGSHYCNVWPGIGCQSFFSWELNTLYVSVWDLDDKYHPVDSKIMPRHSSAAALEPWQ